MIELPEKEIDTEGLQHDVWIFLAQFCTMRYINDARYIPGEPISEIEKGYKR